VSIFLIGHRRVGDGDCGHTCRFRGGDAEGRILEHQTILGRNAQTPGGGEKNIRRRFGRADFRIVRRDDEIEQRKPLTVQGGFLPERLARRTGAHRDRDVVRLEVTHQRFGPRHRLRLGETLAHQRLANLQEFFRSDR